MSGSPINKRLDGWIHTQNDCNHLSAKTYSYDEFVNHMKSCTNLKLSCPNDRCQNPSSFNTIDELRTHLETSCELTELRCVHCHHDFKRRDLK